MKQILADNLGYVLFTNDTYGGIITIICLNASLDIALVPDVNKSHPKLVGLRYKLTKVNLDLFSAIQQRGQRRVKRESTILDGTQILIDTKLDRYASLHLTFFRDMSQPLFHHPPSSPPTTL